MSKKTIISCDICGKIIENNIKINIPTELILTEKRVHKYEDVYEFVKEPTFDKLKEIDVCKNCLSKMFSAVGIEKEGSILK